jgi:gluconate 2-dehydrogenase gamma chain
MDANRRSFMRALGAAGAAGLVPADARAADTPATAAAPDVAAPAPTAPYLFFNTIEAAWVEAAVNRIVPADALGPGGVELGIAAFIDGQLAGAYGQGAKMYLGGPWPAGTPQQGWQLRMTPAACYRAAIPRVDAHCQATLGAAFAALAEAQQDGVLAALEAGGVDLVDLPAHQFFRLLRTNAMQGLFSDPIYGGNRNKLGWKLVGFPGVYGNYVDVIDRYADRPFDVEPAGIAD